MRKEPKRPGKLSPGRPDREKKRPMPQGDKSSYTDKQKRQAEHIEAGYEKKGVSTKSAEARAWKQKKWGIAVSWRGTRQRKSSRAQTER